MSRFVALPIFEEIDRIRMQVQELDRYDPLTSIIKEQFEIEVAKHLTSLSAEHEDNVEQEHPADPLEQIRDRYQLMGQQHAITALFFDLTLKGPDAIKVVLLYEMLFQTSYFPDNHKAFENTINSIEEMLIWFEDENHKAETHPLVLAAAFHHRFSSARLFDDGNGRVGRLLLNILLMRNDYLPILILPSERKTYYKALAEADKGNLSPLSLFVAQKESEALLDFTQSVGYLSVQGKYELELQLKELNGNEKCILLTEDSLTSNLLSFVLESSGFNMDETNIISYEGCSKLASANLFSIFVKEKMPHVKIVVHRDRDYLTDAEVNDLAKQFSRIDVHFFVTNGTDVESYFLNAKHINHCHPAIQIEEAKRLIRQAMEASKIKSVDLLRKKEFGGMRDIRYTHLNKAIEMIVSQNMFRFIHGKTALGKLHKLIQKRAGKRSDIQSPSQFLSDPTLYSIANRIWKKN
jgi:hypothetical protein